MQLTIYNHSLSLLSTLKLVIKNMLMYPKSLFLMVTLTIIGLLGWTVIPFGSGLALSAFSLGTVIFILLYILNVDYLTRVGHIVYIKFTQTRLYRTSRKAGMRISQPLHEMIIGSMLGDCFAEKPSSKHNTRLTFKQSVKNTQYIYHIFSLLSDYCGSVPVAVSANGGLPHMLGKSYFALKFNTLSLACFNIYREMFYDASGLKVIPLNLHEHFTNVSLAYWFMDDGYKFKTGYYFCTESFSPADIQILLSMLQSKFNLDCSVHKTTNGPRIYIMKSCISHFNSLVNGHIVPQFQYKLHL